MAKDNSQNNEQVIRLDDIMYVVIKHMKTMTWLAVIGLLVGILVSFAFYVRGLTTITYNVTASIVVTSTDANGLYSANSSNPNATDIHLAEDITDAVIYVIKSDTTLNAAAEKLQLIGVKADDIKPKLYLSQYEDTQIIEMTLTWDNPEEGVMILNAITDVVPEILIDTLKIGNVSLVNPPKVKTSSLSFINPKIVAICTLLGAFIGAGFFLLKYFLHPTFLHSEDVKELYDLDILGEIPGDKDYFSKKINSLSANEFSSVQEYYSAVAHVLVYRLKEIDNVCVYVTSSAAGEGKTSTTANIAYALADLGYKTLLMDMDVRNPNLATKFIFDRSDKHCLNAVYRGDVNIDDAIVRINSNLDILPTRIEDERIRLDNKIVEIISEAKAEYDFVLIDTAPVGQVSDSMSLNQAADCVLFVIRQDNVWIKTVTESLNRLRKTGIAILGVVMNDTRNGANNYYNYRQFEDSPYVEIPNNKKKKEKSKSNSSISTDILLKRNKNKKPQGDIDESTPIEDVSESAVETSTNETKIEETSVEPKTETIEISSEEKSEDNKKINE